MPNAIMKLGVSVLLLASASAVGAGVVMGGYLVEGVRVFDGKNVFARRSVLIEDGKIVDADFKGRIPPGVTPIKGRGRTLLPGLIDAHVHAQRYRDLPLLFGVTTQIDMDTDIGIMQGALQRMRGGVNSLEADLFSAGIRVTCPNGHGTEFGRKIPTLNTPIEAQAFVDARLAEGSHFIDIVLESGPPNDVKQCLDPAILRAVVAATHLRGKKALVHMSTIAGARAGVEAGADGLDHMFSGSDVTQRDLDSLVALMKQRNVFVISTMTVIESVAGQPSTDLLSDPSLMRLLDTAQTQYLAKAKGEENNEAWLAAPRSALAAMARAKVTILAGDDAGNEGTLFGISMHHELRALNRLGMRPIDVLTAATSAPAEVFGLSDRGMVANGMKADLLLVDGDPTRTITDTRRIVEVWKDGLTVSARRDAKLREARGKDAN